MALQRLGAVACNPVLRTSEPSAEQKLPPVVPDELEELAEALTLLGNYIQTGGNLRGSRRQRLEELLGAIPVIRVAKTWKSGLKELRGELAELEARQMTAASRK